MQQKDFINKNKALNDKSEGGNKYIITLIIIILLSLLIAFQYFNTKTEKQTNDTVVETQDSKLIRPKDDDYLQDIKDYQVNVPITEVKYNGPYMLRCAAFKKRTQAEDLINKLNKLKNLKVKPILKKEGSWFKVQFINLKTRRYGESINNILKRQSIRRCNISKM